MRHRIRDFIDRSFYRREYDARKTLEAFSAKLRGFLLSELSRFVGEGWEQEDDITLMTLERSEKL